MLFSPLTARGSGILPGKEVEGDKAFPFLVLCPARGTHVPRCKAGLWILQQGRGPLRRQEMYWSQCWNWGQAGLALIPSSATCWLGDLRHGMEGPELQFSPLSYGTVLAYLAELP